MLRLLESGADVMGSSGKSPLILAAAEGHADVVEMLMDHGESKLEAKVYMASLNSHKNSFITFLILLIGSLIVA